MEAGASLNSRDAHQVSTLPTAPTKVAPVVAPSVERESAGPVFQSEIQHESDLTSLALVFSCANKTPCKSVK